MKNIIILFISSMFIIIICSFNTFAAIPYLNINLYYDGSSHKYIAEEIYLEVNGECLNNLIMPPVILDGYSLVLARSIFEKMGAVVLWNFEKQDIYIIRGDDWLILHINSQEALYNNSNVSMIVPPKLINSTTMIPVRFVSETLGFNVNWNNYTRTISINNAEDKISIEAFTEISSEIISEFYDINISETSIEIESENIDFDNISINENTNTYIDKNINDSTSDILTLSKVSSDNLDFDKIVEEDDYFNNKYSIILPGDYSNSYGIGEISLDNFKRLNSVNINVTNNETKLIFDEKIISAFIIEEDEHNIYIKCVRIQDKYDKVLVFDAGHGGTAPGAVYNGLQEKDLTLSIVKKIKNFFDNDSSFKVYYTRLDDTSLSLKERSYFGNMIDCPFISVHINAPGSTNSTANGIEVYWQYDNTNDSGLTSSKLADCVYNKLINYTNANPRGVKTSDLHVLREAKNPAILIECGFITHPLEAAKLASIEYQQLLAKAIYDGITEILF